MTVLWCVALAIIVDGSFPSPADMPERMRARFDKAERDGDVEALYHLGLSYQAGLGVDSDINAACYFYEKAAKRGLETAQFHLGMVYLREAKQSPDSDKAVHWLKAAADSGNWLAQLELAKIYEQGLIVEANQREVARLLLSVARTGHMHSAMRLTHGDLRPFLTEAEQAELGRIVGTQDDADALFKLGLSALKSSEGGGDSGRATDLLARAAALGHGRAQLRIGRLYLYGGNGVEKDVSKASLWLEKAAVRGLVTARVELANLYRQELAVPADYVETYRCLFELIQLSCGSEDLSAALTAIEKKMTPAQVAEAKAGLVME